MNDNGLKFDSGNGNTYHATTNLNTAIENPQINMNSAIGVNIQNLDGVDNSYNVNQDLANVNSQIDNSLNTNGLENFSPDGVSYLGNNSAQDLNTDSMSSQFIPNTSGTVSNGSEKVNYESNSNVSYEPTFQEKKKRGSNFQVSREFKLMLFIVFILVLFIFVIPYIYDFFAKLHLVITSG